MQQSLLPGNRIAPAVGRFAGTLLSISLPQVSHLYNSRCHLLTFLKDCTWIASISLLYTIVHYISDTRRRTGSPGAFLLVSLHWRCQVPPPKWAKYHVFFYLSSSHVCTFCDTRVATKNAILFSNLILIAVKLQSERTNVEYSWCHWHLKGSK